MKRLITLLIFLWIFAGSINSALATSYLYVKEYTGEKVSYIDTSTGAVNDFTSFAAGVRAWDLTIGFQENLYVTDYANSEILKVNGNGVVSTFATGITNPKGITYYNNNLYVISSDNTIKQVDSLGNVSTFWAGSGQDLYGVTTGEAGGFTDSIYASGGSIMDYAYAGDGTQTASWTPVIPGAVPTDLTIGFNNALYAVDRAGNVIKINSDGSSSVFYNSGLAVGDDKGIAFDGSYLYITIGDTVARIDQNGVIDLNWAIGMSFPLGLIYGEIPEPASLLTLFLFMFSWGRSYFKKRNNLP